MRKVIPILAVLVVFPRVSVGHTFTGRVERVIDGDTIIVGTNRVRLAEIDAPEIKTPYGPASKKALSEMILHKIVTVEWWHRGRYRRIIGQVYLSGRWVNCDIVAAGLARSYARGHVSAAIVDAEKHARAKASGLWSVTVTSVNLHNPQSRL